MIPLSRVDIVKTKGRGIHYEANNGGEKTSCATVF